MPSPKKVLWLCQRRILGAKRRGKQGSAASIEFVFGLFIFFLLILFPLIDLMGAAVAGATICLLTHQIATRASTQSSIQGALTAMVNESTNLMSSGFANFLHLQRNGGYLGSGCTLGIIATQIGGGSTSYPVPPGLPAAANPLTTVYEYSVHSDFTTTPLVPMSGIPFINNVPMLGKPCQIVWNAARATEYVQGLAAATNIQQGGQVTLPQITAPGLPPVTWLNNGGVSPPFGWRNPGAWGILAGKTILSYDVLFVPSNSFTWVPANMNVPAGASIWIDTHADGIWKGGQVGAASDATGFSATGPGNAEGRVFGVHPTTPPNWNDLIGWVGANPPPVNSASTMVMSPLNPYPPVAPFFILGDNQNTAAPGVGPLSLLDNDAYRPDNMGGQAVRVIIYR